MEFPPPKAPKHRFFSFDYVAFDVHVKSILISSVTGRVTLWHRPTSQGQPGLPVLLGKALPTLTWCDFQYQGPTALVGSEHPLHGYVCENKAKTIEKGYRWHGTGGAPGVSRTEMGIV